MTVRGNQPSSKGAAATNYPLRFAEPTPSNYAWKFTLSPHYARSLQKHEVSFKEENNINRRHWEVRLRDVFPAHETFERAPTGLPYPRRRFEEELI